LASRKSNTSTISSQQGPNIGLYFTKLDPKCGNLAHYLIECQQANLI